MLKFCEQQHTIVVYFLYYPYKIIDKMRLSKKKLYNIINETFFKNISIHAYVSIIG